MTTNYITVIPAYGRDYKTKADMLADWLANKDFIETSGRYGGTYMNRRDAQRYAADHGPIVMMGRYRKARMTCELEKIGDSRKPNAKPKLAPEGPSVPGPADKPIVDWSFLDAGPMTTAHFFKFMGWV